MGTDGACGLLFCAAKRSGAFPPNMPAGLRVKGYCTDRSIFTLLRCTTDELPFSCSRELRLTSSMLPQVGLGANQLLKPASTTPRSYGRRHRSWHCEPQAQAMC
jgi:hypothetical protein